MNKYRILYITVNMVILLMFKLGCAVELLLCSNLTFSKQIFHEGAWKSHCGCLCGLNCGAEMFCSFQITNKAAQQRGDSQRMGISLIRMGWFSFDSFKFNCAWMTLSVFQELKVNLRKCSVKCGCRTFLANKPKLYSRKHCWLLVQHAAALCFCFLRQS